MLNALSRIGQALLVLLGVVTLIFFVLRLVPGDPVAVIAPTATDAARAEIRAQLGLDQPLLTQYLHFLRDILHLDFGQSYFFQGPALGMVMKALPFTAALSGSALLLALLIAVPLGALAAVRAERLTDRLVLGLCLLFQSAPNFWVALLLLTVVAVGTGIFPAVGYVGPISLVLPAVALSLPLIALFAQVVRNAVLVAASGDMATAMKARGIPARRIVMVHALRLSCVPLMTVVGVQLGYLLGGAVIVEYIFNFPGLGLLTLNAVLRRDYPLLQVIILVTAFIFLLINLLIDLSYGLVDGRLAAPRRMREGRMRPGRKAPLQ